MEDRDEEERKRVGWLASLARSPRCLVALHTGRALGTVLGAGCCVLVGDPWMSAIDLNECLAAGVQDRRAVLPSSLPFALGFSATRPKSHHSQCV